MRLRSVGIGALAVLGGVGSSQMIAMLARRAGKRTNDPAGNSGRLPEEPAATVAADDLDREQLEQLHAATLKASDSCFELKKLCATVLVPTGTLVAVFTDKKLDLAVFIAGLLVIVAFWLADAVGYFYQRKLRVVMTAIWERRAERCLGGYDYVPRPATVGAVRSAFNTSMIYYLILGLLVSVALLLFELKIIGL
jgi:hypothetical protein